MREDASRKPRWTGRSDCPGRVVVFRALQLGDMLCAVPALRAIRAALPDSRITLVGLPWARAIPGRFPHYLDDFLEFPGYPGLPERPPDVERIPGFLEQIQREPFDLAVQMHGSGRLTNQLVLLFGARRTAGFYPAGGFCPDPALFLPWPEGGLEVRRLLHLVGFLGMPPQGEALEFPLRRADYQALAAVREARRLEPGRYVCVHPGASVPERRWPAEHFAAVADGLAGRGFDVVLTGTAGETGLTRAVQGRMRGAALDLAGRTDLGALGALLTGARLLVSNDTGVSHLADALRVPSVVVATPENVERWAPVNRHLHRVLSRSPEVGPEQVLREAEGLLLTSPPAAPVRPFTVTGPRRRSRPVVEPVRERA